MNASPETAVYEFHILGHLCSRRESWFEGMAITRRPDGVTVLTGPVVDQAALYGLLSRIRDLGVPLLAVCRLATHDTPTSQPDDGREPSPGMEE